MLYTGSDGGVYRLADVDGEGEPTAEQVLESGRVMRLRSFDGLGGLFAASETGLYHSPDGNAWSDLGVPRDHVYAVVADPNGNRLYTGTRPARVYVSETTGPLDGSKGDDDGGATVAGDEETWRERRGTVHDDVHHLHYPNPDEFVAATGFGLYRSADSGVTWTRLDDGDRRYFREACTRDGVLYAGGAYGSTSHWEEDTGYALFECHDGETLEAVDYRFRTRYPSDAARPKTSSPARRTAGPCS